LRPTADFIEYSFRFNTIQTQALVSAIVGWRQTMAEHRNPTPEAERRWGAVEVRFRHRFNATALVIAAGIILTYVAAKFGVQLLAILCVITVFAGLVRTIYLVVERRRAFLGIMTDDGMTKSEAQWEDFRRHGG
jgi:hypothetical protein